MEDSGAYGLFQIMSPPPRVSIADWVDSSFAKSVNDQNRLTAQKLLDVFNPQRKVARLRAHAAEWLTYLLAVGEDGARPMGEVIGLALERGITYKMLAELVEMMNLQVENHE